MHGNCNLARLCFYSTVIATNPTTDSADSGTLTPRNTTALWASGLCVLLVPESVTTGLSQGGWMVYDVATTSRRAIWRGTLR